MIPRLPFTFMKFSHLLLSLALCSCNVSVERTTQSGDKVVLGRSFMSRSTTESAYYENGAEKMGYTSKAKDETVVPGQAIGTVGTVSTIDAVSSGYNQIQ